MFKLTQCAAKTTMKIAISRKPLNDFLKMPPPFSLIALSPVCYMKMTSRYLHSCDHDIRRKKNETANYTLA